MRRSVGRGGVCRLDDGIVFSALIQEREAIVSQQGEIAREELLRRGRLAEAPGTHGVRAERTLGVAGLDRCRGLDEWR